jgi:CDP-diacylglycerol--glycerol-3-phosphate 3-phosphatidyltransferase
VTGSLVSGDLRSRVRSLAEPVARGFGRLGLTPNHLTLIGFGIAIVAAGAAATQAWLVAGILVIVGGVFDLFDGALARASGRVSRLGAFMDSVFDRWGEAVVYLGIVIGCLASGFDLGVVLAAAAMGAAFMVSYARAKSESLGFTEGTGMAAIGIAPREVRIVILTIGLILTGLVGTANPLLELPPALDLPFGVSVNRPWNGEVWLFWSLLAITILATITVIQRVVHVIRQSNQQPR